MYDGRMPKADPRNYPNPTRDKCVYRVKGRVRAVFYGVLIWCPTCQAYVPASKVGLRTMKGGIIRNQNNCTEHRQQ
jgi:hypothetical protein